MAVQQESVTIVKIISLPVSFISLARASIVADEVFHYDDRRNNELNMKNKLATLQRIYYFWAVDSLQLLWWLRATIQGCGFSLFSRFITFRY